MGYDGGGPFKDNPFAGHAVAAGCAAVASIVIAQPFDTLKTLVQVVPNPGKKATYSQMFHEIKKVSGLAGLYNGLGWTFASRLPGLGLRFGLYEVICAFNKDGRKAQYIYYQEAMIGGILSGAVEGVVATPIEFLKLRHLVSPLETFTTDRCMRERTPAAAKLLPGYAPSKKVWSGTVEILSTLRPKHPGMAAALKEWPWLLTGTGRYPLANDVPGLSKIITLEGWSALWRGLRSGIARDCIFGGVFFTTWEFLRTVKLASQAYAMDPVPRIHEDAAPVHPLFSTVAAGFSGAVAAAVSHPFDTAKNWRQTCVIPKYIKMENKILALDKNGMWIHDKVLAGTWFKEVTGLTSVDKRIWFRGLLMRMARSGISSFALVGSYLFAVHHLV